MPNTYSISVGQPTESLRKQDINSVLLDLPDNTQKMISPKDVRDAFLSAWSTSAFKQTINTSSIEYIGIDSGNPENRDIKQKIFIGKRNYSGQDIMNDALLTSDSDIFFYNTKIDSISQSSTKISILSGTDSNLHMYAPYIKSELSDDGYYQKLEFVNPSLYGGPINIYSSTGRVSINGILFPSISETHASASNGKILKYYGTYPNGSLVWSDPTITIASIGTSDTVTNIYGSPSNVNGYSLEFVEDSIVPKTIGGVKIGSSFSRNSFNGQNWPLSEVIRKLLYPYVPPSLEFSVINSLTNDIYVDSGVTSSGLFSYSITRYSNDITDYKIIGSTISNIFFNVGTYSGLSYSAPVGSKISVTFSYPLYKGTYGAQNYVIRVSDTIPGYPIGYSYSLTSSITSVNPFFFTFSMTNFNMFDSNSGNNLRNLMNYSNKLILPYIGSSQSISVPYNGYGYIYFMIPLNPYGTSLKLSKIKDPNGYIIHDENSINTSSFTYSSSIYTYTPYGNYRIYRTSATCSYSGDGEFKFIF